MKASASAGWEERTTTLLLRTSTYQTGVDLGALALTLSRASLAASSEARLRSTTLACAPEPVIEEAAEASVVATVSVAEVGPLSHEPAKVPVMPLRSLVSTPLRRDSLSRRDSACSAVMPRSRCMALTRPGGGFTAEVPVAPVGACSATAGAAMRVRTLIARAHPAVTVRLRSMESPRCWGVPSP